MNPPQFHTIAYHQIPSKSQQFQSTESTQHAFQSNNAVNPNCRKRNGFKKFRDIPTSYSDPDGEVENSGKSIFKIRNENFCYIHILVFDL